MKRICPNVSYAAVTLVLLLGSAAPAQARALPTPIESSADATHPRVMDEAQRDLVANTPGSVLRLGAAAKGAAPIAVQPNMPALQREIFAFAFGNASLGDATYGYPAWSFNLLTTIAYFGLTIDWDGSIIQSGSGWTTWNSSALTGLISTAHANRDRVIVSVNLHNFTTSSTSTMCAALHPTHRAATVAAIVAQVKRVNADGVNLDYEGDNTVCAYQVGTTQYGPDLQYEMTQLAVEFRAALPSPYYVAADTYSGSAGDSSGFFNVRAMAPYVDSFFVMAYDMEYYNWGHAPLYCSSFCIGPTSPLTTYYYNDTDVMSQYSSAVGPSKTILGVPYYGRKECVAGVTPSTAPANAYPVSGSVASDGYLDASQENGYPLNSDYHAGREVHDTAGNERRDSFYSSDKSCTRQLYFDDIDSLGRKYNLVNRDNLRGVGIFALQYGGGAPELWDALGTHFTKPFALVSANAAPTSMQYTVTEGSYYGGVISSFDLISTDVTAGTGSFTEQRGIPALAAGSGTWTGTATVHGYPGHHYQYQVRAWSYNGLASSWSDPSDVTVSSGATSPLQYKGMYDLRYDGYLRPIASPPVATLQYWTGVDLARAAHPLPGASSPAIGAVLNGYGALVPYGGKLVLANSVYWATQDLARDFAFLPNGTGGYVLDAHGRLWPFAVGSNPLPPAVRGNPVWPTLDIARKVVILPDGTGGYVLDYTGVVNPFAIGSNPIPASPALTRHWPGEDFARDMVLVPGTRSGYVLNGYGGLYAFTAPGEATPTVPTGSLYWSGHDVARAFFLLPGSTAAAPGGYVMDCAGGLSIWGNATGPSVSGQWSCGSAKAATGG